MTSWDIAAVGTLLSDKIALVGPVLAGVAGAGILIWLGFFGLDLGKKAAKKAAK